MIKRVSTVLLLIGSIFFGNIFQIDQYSWNIFCLFTFTLLNMLFEIFDLVTMSIIIIAIGSFDKTIAIKDLVSVFGFATIWQILGVFFIAQGIIKTNLSKRIAYHIIYVFGKTTLGLSYGIALTNVIIGPLIPSSTARIGVIFKPILDSIFDILETNPQNNTQKKAGSFLVLSCLYTNSIVSATFLTAMTGNLLIQNLSLQAGIKITWFSWFQSAFLPFLISLAIIPLILYYIYPPELKNLSHIKEKIEKEIEKLGPISTKEIGVISVLSFILFGWISNIIDPLLTTFIGLVTLLILEMIDIEEDILGNKQAWSTLFWMSILIMLSQKINETIFLKILVENLRIFVESFHTNYALLIIILFYAYSHYIFGSVTSHISSLFIVALSLAINFGYSPILCAHIFAFLSNLFSGLTHYTSSEAILLSKMNYVEKKDFLKYGFIISTISTSIWLLSGAFWWKMLGLY